MYAGVVRLVRFLPPPGRLSGLPPRSIRRRPLVAELLLCLRDLVLRGGVRHAGVPLQPCQLGLELCVRCPELLHSAV